MILRFLIVAIVIYFFLRFLGRVLTSFLNKPDPPNAEPPPSPSSQKPKEEYTDVRDARFTDIGGKATTSDASKE